MPRHIAFLRAINVGGHTVKMDHLRRVFESLGFTNVETFIASGNVIFSSPSKGGAALEKKIAARLHDEFGFEVATFLRTDSEVARIAQHKAFKPADVAAAAAFCVAFLADALDAKAKTKLMTLRTEIDDFVAHDREVYWLCRKKQSESKFSNAVFEKALGRQATFRGINTVVKIAAKYPPAK